MKVFSRPLLTTSTHRPPLSDYTGWPMDWTGHSPTLQESQRKPDC